MCMRGPAAASRAIKRDIKQHALKHTWATSATRPMPNSTMATESTTMSRPAMVTWMAWELRATQPHRPRMRQAPASQACVTHGWVGGCV